MKIPFFLCNIKSSFETAAAGILRLSMFYGTLDVLNGARKIKITKLNRADLISLVSYNLLRLSQIIKPLLNHSHAMAEKQLQKFIQEILFFFIIH